MRFRHCGFQTSFTVGKTETSPSSDHDPQEFRPFPLKCDTLRRGQLFLPEGNNLNNLCRDSLEDATRQITGL